jgi:hypothetical protein
MCSPAVSTENSAPKEHSASEWSAFARSGSEFQCLRGFHSTDNLFVEPIQSFTDRLLADDWCHEVRHGVALHSGRHNLGEIDGKSANF